MKTIAVMIMLSFLFYDFGKVEQKYKSHNDLKCCHRGKRTIINYTVEAVPYEFIPDVTIQLTSGNNKHLHDFIDCKKYIYITFLENIPALSVEKLKAYDSIGKIYKSRLTLIVLLSKGNAKQLNRLIEKYQLHYLIGAIPERAMQIPNGKVYPNGMLFSKYGKLIKEMSREELEMYMKKHVGVERAKF